MLAGLWLEQLYKCSTLYILWSLHFVVGEDPRSLLTGLIDGKTDESFEGSAHHKCHHLVTVDSFVLNPILSGMLRDISLQSTERFFFIHPFLPLFLLQLCLDCEYTKHICS